MFKPPKKSDSKKKQEQESDDEDLEKVVAPKDEHTKMLQCRSSMRQKQKKLNELGIDFNIPFV